MARQTKKYFGTDGIRGRANEHPMDGEMAMRVGRAIVARIRQMHPEARMPRVLVGKDTRLSCYMLETALSSGVASMGGEAFLTGPIPTPAVSFLTTSMRTDAGVMISASHNAFDDNGIKVFGPDGLKLTDREELELEALIDGNGDLPRPAPESVGKMIRINDAVGRYIVEIKHSLPRGMMLSGLRVVVDCAHGAAYQTAPLTLRELGADVITAGVEPSGTNINEKCGSLHPEVAAALVKKYRADVGLALDGDADRVIVVDEKGRTVDGDAVMALCATHMIKERKLKRKTIVATIMSNIGLERALQEVGGRVVRCDVGDRYVAAKMLRHGYNLGGEQSGHLIFLDHALTGDGMLAGLQIMSIMLKEDRPLSRLAGAVFERVPQVLVNVAVDRKRPLDRLSEVQKRIDRARGRLGDEGRVVVRYSGTEPKARVMVEGPDRRRIRSMAEEIAASIEKACRS
jgi:phosphoglucosamine mutase